MKQREVKGIVLRVVDLKESDRLITIFTEEEGIVSALARGAKNIKNKNFSATGQFCYSSFVLTERADKNWISESQLIEGFFGIRGDLTALALASYIVEFIDDVAVSELEPELLRLALNSLYAISSRLHPFDKIKAVFEMRAVSILGFMPEVRYCRECGDGSGEFFFDIMAGAAICRACRDKLERQRETLSEGHETHIVTILTPGAREAMEYSIYAPIERIFSFKISGEDMQSFAISAEKYTVNHLERSYNALEFYNEVK